MSKPVERWILMPLSIVSDMMLKSSLSHGYGQQFFDHGEVRERTEFQHQTGNANGHKFDQAEEAGCGE
ncbi:hypothetical protein RvY_14870 [Ramazzottius varieornatus]|uniref:Uncharacterized protein n=1 Tax=Ramazzottius varieornatus TaxID=947166 RepID=A0A1D1VXR4_RAMVA|nr:hypothetical protein RvY_14870 [Ramazzottius varieornatus]